MTIRGMLLLLASPDSFLFDAIKEELECVRIEVRRAAV
jgi:hypothetical protein